MMLSSTNPPSNKSSSGGIDLNTCDEFTRRTLKPFNFNKDGFISNEEEVVTGARLYDKLETKNIKSKKLIKFLIAGGVILVSSMGRLVHGI